MQLSGKRALVIGGGGGGIGRAVTEAFGNEGAAVVVADLDPGRAEEAAEAVRQRGGTAYPVSGDVRSLADIEAMVAAAVEKLGGLDVLVTVVGGQVAFVPAVKLHEMADEDWDTIYEVNLRYVARAVRTVLDKCGGPCLERRSQPSCPAPAAPELHRRGHPGRR